MTSAPCRCRRRPRQRRPCWRRRGQRASSGRQRGACEVSWVARGTDARAADETAVVGLGGEDAGGGGEDVLVLDERGGAVVRRDARVLEQEGAEQEVGVARVLPGQRSAQTTWTDRRERVVGADDAGGLGSGGERRVMPELLIKGDTLKEPAARLGRAGRLYKRSKWISGSRPGWPQVAPTLRSTSRYARAECDSVHAPSSPLGSTTPHCNHAGAATRSVEASSAGKTASMRLRSIDEPGGRRGAGA